MLVHVKVSAKDVVQRAKVDVNLVVLVALLDAKTVATQHVWKVVNLDAVDAHHFVLVRVQDALQDVVKLAQDVQ